DGGADRRAYDGQKSAVQGRLHQHGTAGGFGAFVLRRARAARPVERSCPAPLRRARTSLAATADVSGGSRAALRRASLRDRIGAGGGPADLAELLDARVRGLIPTQRRILQALSIAGTGTGTELAALLEVSEREVTDELPELVAASLVETVSGVHRITHQVIAE